MVCAAFDSLVSSLVFGNHIIDYEKRLKWQNTIFAWFAKWLQDDASAEDIVQDCFIKIWDSGTKHSLNVSVTAGIVVWVFFRSVAV